ncbi:MAG TPA: RpiB/LacA/LacB family sugar-phosphate isomerase [Tepidisphaeraceae bacterium]|jgi:ribose 5-phosphate isomerase RpiB
MIFTARQLEDLHKTNGHVVLPYGARLTPLAVDWARARRIQVGYGPDELVKTQGNGSAKPIGEGSATKPQTASGAFLWWCDGPCGAAKAAAGAVAKESNLLAIDLPADGKQLVPVIKRIAAEVKQNKATGGVLMLASGGAALVLANRSPVLRAVLGTTFESLESAIASVAANVLVIEYPRKSFSEIRNLLSRFVRARREPSEELARQMKELAAEATPACGCGGGGGRH